ncbi:HD domain-containing protein [Anaerovorax odorimutans]|uniref:HD domain-containing protein n=1 Tax=Anaerovorax odorimutans TaxID=109327 RepID=UPI00041C9714|nr:HD domain-containing protein [Anaerovorax odorimutans]
MERINKILSNKIFKHYLYEIESCEKDRIFCKHDMTHFLDVARIAYIINLENNYNMEKDLIYAAALLHDCGKSIQYNYGIPHNIASCDIAKDILSTCDFTEKEISAIICAIRDHRNSKVINEFTLSELLYKADKMSRNCFNCSASKDCNWSNEKKNLKILI